MILIFAARLNAGRSAPFFGRHRGLAGRGTSQSGSVVGKQRLLGCQFALEDGETLSIRLPQDETRDADGDDGQHHEGLRRRANALGICPRPLDHSYKKGAQHGETTVSRQRCRELSRIIVKAAMSNFAWLAGAGVGTSVRRPHSQHQELVGARFGAPDLAVVVRQLAHAGGVIGQGKRLEFSGLGIKAQDRIRASR